MIVKVLREAGHFEALLGLSLSYNCDPDRRPAIAQRLAHMEGGHNKFLESLVLWLDIKAPRYFWVDFDAYRIGVTKQSESTQHGWSRPLVYEDFAHTVHLPTLKRLNSLIERREVTQLKAELPEGFLQRRIVCLNYKVLRHIILQRHDHRMQEWHLFCNRIIAQVDHPEYLPLQAQ